MSFKWLNYLGDLLTGRISGRVTDLHNKNKDNKKEIKELKKTMTANETKVLEAANAMAKGAAAMNQGASAIKSMRTKIDKLVEAAQSTTPLPNPENLDEEFTTFDQAAQAMNEASQAIMEAINGGATATEPGQSPPIIADPMPNNTPEPINHDEMPIPPTPVAGESGPTDMPAPVAEGEPNPSTPNPEDLANQDTLPSVPVEEGVPPVQADDDSLEPVADNQDVEVPADPGANPAVSDDGILLEGVTGNPEPVVKTEDSLTSVTSNEPAENKGF